MKYVMMSGTLHTLYKQWSNYEVWNKLFGLILDGNKYKLQILTAQLNIIEFSALDKLKCPGVMQIPKRANSFNATKQIVGISPSVDPLL